MVERKKDTRERAASVRESKARKEIFHPKNTEFAKREVLEW